MRMELNVTGARLCMTKSNENEFLTKLTKFVFTNVVFQVCQGMAPSSTVSQSIPRPASAAFKKPFCAI